jgi:DNA phosphorothioation-dependent restriction protein DptH
MSKSPVPSLTEYTWERPKVDGKSWEFGHPNLNNRHILHIGQSGTGKTYAIQAILCELSLKEQDSSVIDYTNGTEDTKLENETKSILKPSQHLILDSPLPINPFRRQANLVAGKIRAEKLTNTALRVSGVFSSVCQLGEQQKAVLYQAIIKGLRDHEQKMDLETLRDILEQENQQI